MVRSVGARWLGVSTTFVVGGPLLGSVDVGFVPVAGVGSDGGECLGLQRGAAGGERDLAAVGVESDAADAVEFAQGPWGGQVLVGEVGVVDVCFGEVLVDEGFDDGGVDADSDVAADSFFGPVADGS